MFRSPWINLTRSRDPALRIEASVYKEIVLPDSAEPSLITLIGKHQKSAILREFLGGPECNYPQEPHGQIHLWPDTCFNTKHTTLFADFEMAFNNDSHWIERPSIGVGKYIPIKWSRAGEYDTKSLSAALCARVLCPLSNVICIFASDFQGIRGTASFINQCIQFYHQHDLSRLTKPRLIVVAPIRSKGCEEEIEITLTRLVKQYLEEVLSVSDDNYVENLIHTCFHSIRVISLCPMNTRERAKAIRLRLDIADTDARNSRTLTRTQFSYRHFKVFTRLMISHLCKYESPFSFVKYSRPHGFDSTGLSRHLDNLLDSIQCEAWLWHFVIPLLASSLLLASYPHGSHYFLPTLTFETLYEESVRKSIQNYTPYPSTHDKFMKDLRTTFGDKFNEFIHNGNLPSMHKRQLGLLNSYFSQVQSHFSCLSCVIYTADKVLDCGHAMCDNCIKIFGSKSSIDSYTYSLSECLFCSQAHSRTYRFIPPTAGIRLLSLDGGGIRGIITLTVLAQLEKELSYLQCPIWDCFDSVVGTSSGGLTSIGIFLMHWTAEECLEKFHNLTKEVFGGRKNLPALVDHAQTLLLLCLDRSKYDSLGIKAAFRTALGPPPNMFNPLATDTKVAVIAAPVTGSATAVLCNYNSGKRPEAKELGYRLISAAHTDSCITIDEAAQCTSAAPGFFKPVFLKYFGKLQDGAVHCNNPGKIGVWEIPYIWPQKKSQPDVMLSIGTGWAENLSLGRPKSPGFFTRFSDLLDWNLSGDRQHKELINFTPPDSRNRLHRIDLKLDTKEPAIDNVAMTDSLRLKTEAMLIETETLSLFHSSWLATLFCVEIQSMPEEELSCFRYKAKIFCRHNLTKAGTKALCEKLKKSGAYFLVNEKAVACTKDLHSYNAPFKCVVEFTVDDPSNTLFISLGIGMQEERWPISGMPRGLEDLTNIQGLDSEFGRSDHQHTGGHVSVPLKRSRRNRL